MIQTAERVSQHDQSDNYVFQRSILAYHKAAEIVNGKVLELGTGMGYGIEIVGSVALEIDSNTHNEFYLKTKRDKMGHAIR